MKNSWNKPIRKLLCSAALLLLPVGVHTPPVEAEDSGFVEVGAESDLARKEETKEGPAEKTASSEAKRFSPSHVSSIIEKARSVVSTGDREPEALRAIGREPRGSLRTDSNAPASEGQSPEPSSPLPPEALAEPPMLSLIVAAKPRSHLLKHLKELAAFTAGQKIMPREVYVIGALDSQDEEPFLLDKSLQSAMKKVSEAGYELPLKLADSLPDKYEKVSSSPVWVVSHQGQEHVFEGGYDLYRLFDSSGNFVGASEP